MRIKKIKVPFYKWNIQLAIMDDHKKDGPIVLKKMKALHMPDNVISDMDNQINNKCYGGGAIYSNDGNLLHLVVILPHKDNNTLVSTLLHEARHAADIIIESVRLEGDEAAAYLSEYISTKFIEDYIKDEKI